KQRRPKHLLTGLVHCGECGGSLTAIGKDYLACAAARSGAGCRNRKSVKRARIEEVGLEGLKSRLMAPELAAEFVRSFHEAGNRQRQAEDLRLQEMEAELRRLTFKLKGLYDAIADGLRTPGLKAELEELERRQSELKDAIAAAPVPQPRLHPKLAE